MYICYLYAYVYINLLLPGCATLIDDQLTFPDVERVRKNAHVMLNILILKNDQTIKTL